MKLLERILGDPETPLVPSSLLVPTEELEPDEPGPDLGDADGAEKAGRKKTAGSESSRQKPKP